MYSHTIVVSSWTDIPSRVRGDCMCQVAPGCYGHLRLDMLFVCLDEANSSEGTAALIDEVLSRSGLVV